MENTTNNKTATQLYRELIQKTLIDNNVKSIVCENKKEHFFDRIDVQKDGTLTVTHHTKFGDMHFQNLCFDFTCDYARCLSYIEDAIFRAIRNMDSNDKFSHGMIIEFNK